MNYWGPGQLRWVKNQLDVANREYDYDAAGKVSVFRNAGLRETMTYDAAGRQTGRRFNSGERVTQMQDHALGLLGRGDDHLRHPRQGHPREQPGSRDPVRNSTRTATAR